MSTVYVLEPPTKGKVIMKTSYGGLDIELWPKEAPKAVRNFVQLCMEGYYDNTVFHRVIKSFLVQGGDPTGTGEGGESIYGGVFADEFHSRLRFKHRGLIACAGSGTTPNSNGSQFFMTLDRCDWLDKKHTIFGKVTGDSIFNLLQLGEVEADKNDRPLEPIPRILSVEVLWNPFDDIVPRILPSMSLPSSEKKEPKPKITKNLNLLSFGEEAEEEEKELAAVTTRIKSSHDVLNDPRLLKEASSHDKDLNLVAVQKGKDMQLTVREALSSKGDRNKVETGRIEPLDYSDDEEENFDARMRQQILRKKKEIGSVMTKQEPPNDGRASTKHVASQPKTSAEKHDNKPRKDKLSLRRKGIGSEARAERVASADADLQLLREADRERQLIKQKRRRRQGHEDDVLARLEKMKSKLSYKQEGSVDEPDKDSGEAMSDWVTHTFAPLPEPGKDKMSRNNDPNQYVVLDPLLEKGKEKFNRMMAKEKRKQREWAGKSLT